MASADPQEPNVPIEGQLTFQEALAQEEAAEQATSQLIAPQPVSDERPPRIRALRFRNFKGFADLEVDVGEFNVLVGPNNAGKSTLLQGIDLLFALIKLHRDGDRLSSSGRIMPAALLPVAGLRDLFFRQIWRQANEYVEATIGAVFSDASRVEFGIRLLFGNANSRVLDHEGIDAKHLDALIAWPAVWVPSSVGIVRDEEYRTPARRAALINAGRHNEVLRNLLLALGQERPEEYDVLQRTLQERFGAQLAGVAFNEFLDQFVSSDYRAEDGGRHDLYSAGSGFVQVVQLLTFILLRDANVVLLDEPDAHLHSSLQRVVVEVLDDLSRERQMQVIISTHSKEIINFVDPTRLIFIERGGHQAAPYAADVTPMTILRSLGAIDNVDAYALVKNRRCLFVEGTDDATILGRFAAKLGIRALTGDDRVVTVPVGGADRFEHVQQLDVFESMLGEPVETLEIRDRDGRTDDHRELAVERSPRPLIVLERDSIESYLLEPRVISRVVGEVSTEKGGEAAPEPEDITALMSNVSDELRATTEDRVAERYAFDVNYFSKERVSIQTANQEARAFVADRWDTLEQRLQVVSGKRLLGAVRARIQDLYGVNFGNERLAETFEADEIPNELRDALQQVSQLGQDG